jgi:hypothetical protein
MVDVDDILDTMLWFIFPIYLLWRALQEDGDNKKIVGFLASRENGWTWRSTHAISVRTNIPKDRVRKLCGWHNKIIQSDKREDMWRLAE